MTALTDTKDERLSIRIHGDVKESIEAAARLRGLSVSEFIISTAAEAAHQIISEHRVLRLTDQEFSRFCAALEEDVAPNAAAMEAARRFKASRRERRVSGES